ncbi:glycosyltransferase involved in cell wall biosynthesis [Chryseobacterium ginsenosidimutans]|uniref:glycosyltransferase family 4 protein n=1 Tax=Chryseobacterium ginsenosidimutans TaxID=687846 RepID=UPI002781D471|nr:glycosyltransferase family 4 protein [Chryseobacterium ginsenosidimutans]MDQ0595108.1 glycosyltransferase involved in cell wall biosynthesis [Chryseobacterium ginsenosidimutans]
MILHITNDYSGSAVYKNLIRELDHLSLEQTIYNPVREASRIGKNGIDLKNNGSQIIYSHILSKYTDRIFYQQKIKKIVQDIEAKVDLSKIKFIHAHTWYSDGGVAYELHKKYKIPYIVAVRNTDLNLFLKYFLHERSYGKKILLAADKIITISAVYKKRMLEDPRLASIISETEKKVVVIPNGVDPYWIESKVLQRKNIGNNTTIQLLYIGKFDKGKNVINLINAVKNLNRKNENMVKLTLIGGGGNDEKNILNSIKDDESFNYVGKIYDLQQLKMYYEQSDIFTMPSKAETFGLVYMEALLQGLPILYTQNEGIDGFYDDPIGEKVENTSVEEIQHKVERLISNYNQYNFSTEKFSRNHDWKRIAETYHQLYTK